MKIVHVANGYLPQDSGGVQIHIRDLCEAQSRRGHEVEIFTRAGGGEDDELSLSRDEVESVPVTRLEYNFLDADRFEKLYTNELIDERFRGFLDGARPDLVHVHHLTCLSTSMIRVAKELRIPVVMTLHDYWLLCPRGQRLHPDDLSVCETLDRDRCLPCVHKLWPHLLAAPDPAAAPGEDPSMAKLLAWDAHVREMLALCDATIAVSAFHRDRFVDAGLPPERSHVVANGISAAALRAEPRGRWPIRHVGFIGTVIPSKGVHVLIEAFNLLGREELVLDVYGEVVPYHEKNDYLAELETAVQPGLEVRFHGRYEHRDLPRIFVGLDLLVVPALWWEAFCLTAREGALAGLPVVASRIGGLAEAVEEGLALGFEAGNAEELAAAIARLCDDQDLRDEMSRKAHLVRDVEQCAADTDEVYRAALDRAADRATVPAPGPAARVETAPSVSLVIPTWNAGPEFPEILELMRSQDFAGELEVVVIDSGSTDGTVAYLKTRPVRLIEIPNSEFNHGLTRNRGIEEARGEIVVLATQDARPCDRQWLPRLVDCFRDPGVAGAYSCQTPRPDANPFIKDRLSNWVASQTEPRVQEVANRDEYEALAPLEKLARVAFDNVSSSVRRSVALEIPFRKRQFGEDIDWGHRVILAGHKIVFEPRSKVIHSHNNSIWYELKRVYLDHQNLHRLFGVQTIPRKEDVWPCCKGAILHLFEVVRRAQELGPLGRLWWKIKAVPFGISQNLAQYLGARSVWRLREDHAADRLLDALLRRGV